MHNRGRRIRFSERLAQMCDVPQEAIVNIPVFVIRGRREIEVAGCDGIIEYGDDHIVLNMGKDIFSVEGDGLVLSDFKNSVLFVRGNIVSVSFSGSDTDA